MADEVGQSGAARAGTGTRYATVAAFTWRSNRKAAPRRGVYWRRSLIVQDAATLGPSSAGRSDMGWQR